MSDQTQIVSFEKPIIESIRSFIENCPFLTEYANLMIDRLEGDVASYSIETVPCDPIVKRYVNGTSQRRFEFYFTSTEAYTQEVLDEISNSAFYEHFAAWMEQCTRSQNLPILDGDRLSIKLEALTPGYIVSSDETTARYVIQCRLTYMQND